MTGFSYGDPAFARAVMRMSHGRRRRHRGGPFGRGMNFGGPFGPGRRAARGDIRAAILVLLQEQPMHGYQIIQELAERTEGVWRANPGSVYPTLSQLEDEGLVEAQQAAGKRVFTLTDQGKAEAARQPAAPWDEVASSADAQLVELRDLAFAVLGAIKQIATTGTPAQVESAKGVLRDARKRLYGLLAEDAPAEDAPGETDDEV